MQVPAHSCPRLGIPSPRKPMGSGGGDKPTLSEPFLLSPSAGVAFPPELGNEPSTPRPEFSWAELFQGMQCHGEVQNNLQPGLKEQLLALLGFQGPQLLLSSPCAGRSSEVMDWTSVGRSFPAVSEATFVTPCQLSNPCSEHWRSEFLKETVVRICLK